MKDTDFVSDKLAAELFSYSTLKKLGQGVDKDMPKV
jgi:hypothetical protein